jgi:hypothetical protein
VNDYFNWVLDRESGESKKAMDMYMQSQVNPPAMQKSQTFTPQITKKGDNKTRPHESMTHSTVLIGRVKRFYDLFVELKKKYKKDRSKTEAFVGMMSRL